MIHNSDYDFATAPDQVKLAFTSRFGVHRVLLDAATRLYKFTEHPLSGPRGVTPWWHFLDACTVKLETGAPFQVPGYDTARQRAARIGVPDRDFGRARSAVSREWNRMTRLVKIRLNQKTYAFFGQNAGMPLDGEAPDPHAVKLIGGNYQLFVPNLNASHVRQIPG